MADARSIALVCANEASLWAELQARATVVAQAEPALAPMLHRYVLDRSGFGEGIIQRLAERVTPTGQDLPVILRVLGEAVASDREVLSQMRADIRATLERDPATEHALIPYLWYKGFHAISTHRLAHALWKAGRKELATHLQSLVSEHLGVDIHPAARFGVGILLDHATGFVAGETSVVADNVSFLHEVTLGGTGKARGDRHPKIRSGVRERALVGFDFAFSLRGACSSAPARRSSATSPSAKAPRSARVPWCSRTSPRTRAWPACPR